ncbi:MAG: TetR/AcrR family transcriptional regulator [Spirochaetes bacterium]|nr:TetR/AcrR family transcriptional regulator [Spirochaetota bacterium]
MPAKGQKRKDEIIEASKKMFIERGYQSTHIGEVCSKLNIARGTVYQYFGNKREILFAIMEGVEEELDDIFDRDDLFEYLDDNSTREDIVLYLNKRVSRCVKTLISEPIIIKLIFKEIIGIDEEVIDRVSRFNDYVSRVIARDIEDLKKKGYYKERNDSRLSSLVIMGGVLFLVHEYIKTNTDVSDPRIIEDIVDSYMNGMLI